MTRRDMLRLAGLGIAGAGAAALVGCDGDDEQPAATATAPGQPTAEAAATPASGATPSAATRPRWVPLTTAGDAPSARRDHSLTADPDSGVLYVFGGRSAGTSMADLWALDTGTPAWQRIDASGPGPRFGHNAAWDRAARRLIITGGQRDGATFYGDIWGFEPSSRSWTMLGPGPTPRPEVRYGAASAYDAEGVQLFISHGFTNQGRFDDTWTFDLQQSVWTPSVTTGAVPVKRCLTRAAWDAQRMQLLMFGGQADATPFLGDFWVLDVAQGTWSERSLSPSPSARNLYGADVDGRRRWWLFGGNTPNGPVNDLWAYDIVAGTWTAVDAAGAAQVTARESPDVAFVGERMFLFGGRDSTGELNDVWALETA